MSTTSPDSPSLAPAKTARRVPQIIALSAMVAATALVILIGHPHPHAPDWTPVLEAPPQIQVHLGAAVIALLLGAVQMLSPKGTLPHRIIGWVWVVLMMVLAGVSVFIKTLSPGHFSLIHLLTAWVLLAVPLAVMAVRRGNVAAHSYFMTGLFYTGLITAGAFTFMPGRVLYKVFLGH